MSTVTRRLVAACLLVMLAGLGSSAGEKKRGRKRPIPPKTPRPSSTVRGHRLLFGGTELGYVYLLGSDGKVEWSHPSTGPVCDLGVRKNGNVLFSDRNSANEVRPDKTVVWQFRAPKGCEIFTCQPLPDGKVMILVNGTPPRIMEFDTATGKLEKTLEVPCATKNVHGQFRVARKTSKGTYLLPYLSENKVCELDATGKVIRTIPDVKGPFQAELLENGNILVAGGTGRQILEVAPDDKVVWKVAANDLPGEPLKFVAGIQRLPNGNTLFANWAGHVGQAPTAQMVEVTPGKEIVWKFNDWDSFFAISSVRVLDEAPRK